MASGVFLSLHPSVYALLLPLDAIGPTWIIQDNLPSLESAD